MKIILLGAYGRLGTAIENTLTEHSFLTPMKQEVDLTNSSQVNDYLASHPADIVVNCAAYNNVDGAEQDPAVAERINAESAGAVAGAAAAVQLPVVHFSTDYVFDGSAENYNETSTPNPLSVYGWSKLHGEQAVIKNNPRHYVIRTSRLYGPPARDPEAKRSFVDIIINQASKESAFTVKDVEISAPTSVIDLAQHLNAYILKALPEPGIYHMANSGGCTWFGWAQAILEITKSTATITPAGPNDRPRLAKAPPQSVLLSTKIPPMRPWRVALEDYLLNYVTPNH